MAENRRQFLKMTVAATALSRQKILGANERIRVGAIGTGGRTQYLMRLLNQIGGSEIMAVCDVYEPRRLQAKTRFAPNASEHLDYREVLDRKDVHAVVIGSPDHWHVPMTVDAVRAGKDVYVEKPLTHTIEEGKALENAVAGSGRVVQVGYQQRSWDHFRMGAEIVTSGRLGKITLVLTSWYQNYLNGFGAVPEVATDKLDWKRWLGSAPDQPFDALRFTLWRWFWDFGGGHLTDLFSHWVDTIQWYMGVDRPLAAQAMGARHALPELECPETINACYHYPGNFSVVYNGTLVGSLDGGNVVIRGRRGVMKLNRDGLAVYPEGVVQREKTQYPEPEIQIRSREDGTVSHMNNFLDCVKSRKTPNAPAEVGVSAARAAHIGNLALRQKRRIPWKG
jgi:predicted dehydrogenase